MRFHVSQQHHQSTKDIKDEVPWNLGSEHVHKTGSLEMDMDSYASMDKRYKQMDYIRSLKLKHLKMDDSKTTFLLG